MGWVKSLPVDLPTDQKEAIVNLHRGAVYAAISDVERNDGDMEKYVASDWHGYMSDIVKDYGPVFVSHTALEAGDLYDKEATRASIVKTATSFTV